MPWKKGRRAWNKGLTKETDNRVANCSTALIGHVVSDVTRKKISTNKNRNEKISKSLLGRSKYSKTPEETRRKHSKAMKTLWNDDSFRIRTIESQKAAQNTPEQRQRHLEKLKSMASNSTKRNVIEIKLEAIVKNLGYNYIPQHRITDITLADGFVEPNFVFFADGDYWHNRLDAHEKDAKVNTKLISKDYVVLRFWEHEINKEPEKVKEKIRSVLGEAALLGSRP